MKMERNKFNSKIFSLISSKELPKSPEKKRNALQYYMSNVDVINYITNTSTPVKKTVNLNQKLKESLKSTPRIFSYRESNSTILNKIKETKIFPKIKQRFNQSLSERKNNSCEKKKAKKIVPKLKILNTKSIIDKLEDLRFQKIRMKSKYRCSSCRLLREEERIGIAPKDFKSWNKNLKRISLNSDGEKLFRIFPIQRYTFSFANIILVKEQILYLYLSSDQKQDALHIIYYLSKTYPKIFGKYALDRLFIYKDDLKTFFKYEENVPFSKKPYHLYIK